MAETTCPVLRPTEQEFKSFRRYIEEVVDPVARKAGLCKVIPPPGWAARRRHTAEEMCKSVHIPAPIKQCVSSTRSNGVYSVDVVENPPMSLAEFKEYADKRAPFPSSTASAGCLGSAAVGVRRGRSGGGVSLGAADDSAADGEGPSVGGGGYGGGYGTSYGGGGEAPSGVGLRTEESEVARRVRMFWRSLGPNSEAPIYGADTLGTLFSEEDEDSWNVSRLDTILQLLKANLPGITTPMLYAGMWRSMFAFHVEDMNLYSINYLHRGDPKSWYGIPPDSRQRFESLAQAFFTEEFRACKHHMRHKTTMISPLQIQKAGISYCTAVQEAGEFMITFPGSYHGGFNHGFNLAESTNFAIDRWIREGRGAGYCRCSPHSVRIDVDRFEILVRQHRRIAGRDSTCLNGLAEAPVGASLTGSRARRIKSSEGPSDARVTKAAEEAQAKGAPHGGSCDGAGLDAERKNREEEEEEEEEEEDFQVFHCVCSNARSVRRVKWKKNGDFVVIPAGKSSPTTASAVEWPDKELSSECPRCGVWGHRACLEYVLPPQYAISEVKAGSSAPTVPVRGDGGGVASGGEASSVGKASDLSATSRAGETCATSSVTGPSVAAEGGEPGSCPPEAVPRPVCWMCTQELEDLAAAAGGSCGGGAAAAPPRRSGKGSGGSNSGAGGGGGGVCGATRDGVGEDKGNAKRKGTKKKRDRDKNGKGGETKEGKPARVSEAGSGDGGENQGGGPAGGKVGAKTVAQSSLARTKDSSALPPAKRARVGPKLVGKEVRVSDGVAAVLPGVITAIEAGQARVHYKGRNAKLDEWIDVHSERFLSATEAKKQIELAHLAMTPSAATVPTPPRGPTVAKRKTASGGGGKSTVAVSSAKRLKKSGEGVDGEKAGTARGEAFIPKKVSKAGTAGDGSKMGQAKSNAKANAKANPKVNPKANAKANAKANPKSNPKANPKVKSKANAKANAKASTMSLVANGETEAPGAEKHMKDRKSPSCSSKRHGGGAGGGESIASANEGGDRSKSSLQKPAGGAGNKSALKKGGKGASGPENKSVGKKTVQDATRGSPASQIPSGSGSLKKKSGGVVKARQGTAPSGRAFSVGKSKQSSNSMGRGIGGGGGVSGNKSSSAAARINGEEGKKKTKKPRTASLSIKPVAIAPPVVVQKDIPEHHVISSRRAAVLARTFAKETEQAQKDFEEAVAAAERSRLVREQRLRAAASSPRGDVRHTAPSKGASSAAAAAVRPADGSGRIAGGGGGCGGGPGKQAPSAAPATTQTSSVKGGAKWPELGFVGQPWGLGPFLCQDDFDGRAVSYGSPRDGEPRFSQSEGPSHKDGQDVDPMEGGGSRKARSRVEGSSSSLAAAAAATAGGVPTRPRRARKEMRRARVEAGEALDLGEEAGFRRWLARLRSVQDTPVGHVEECSHSLAVLLGTSPPDGSIRSSLRALLVAETLRGGASQEVGAFVRSLAGLMADAAARSRGLEAPVPALTSGDDSSNGGTRSPSVWRDSGAGADDRGENCGVGDTGDASDRALCSILDTEGAAAYAHALVHVARSRGKQKRMAAAAAATAAAQEEAKADASAATVTEAQTGKIATKGKEAVGEIKQRIATVETGALLRPVRAPSAVVAGSVPVPGKYPFSGNALHMHAKAMVGLKRTHRWIKAWMNATSALPLGQKPTGGINLSGANASPSSNNSSSSSSSSSSLAFSDGAIRSCNSISNDNAIISSSSSNCDSSNCNTFSGSSHSSSSCCGGSNSNVRSSSESKSNNTSGSSSSISSNNSYAVSSSKTTINTSITSSERTKVPVIEAGMGDRAYSSFQTGTPVGLAAHASPLVAAAAASAAAAAAAASALHSPTSASALFGWQNALLSLPQCASAGAGFSASVLSSPPDTLATGANRAANVPATLCPRPGAHSNSGTSGGIGTGSAYNAMLSWWPPQLPAAAQVSPGAAAAASTLMPCAAAAPVPAAATGRPMTLNALPVSGEPASNCGAAIPSGGWSNGEPALDANQAMQEQGNRCKPVDLLERWERVGAVVVSRDGHLPEREKEDDVLIVDV